MPSLFSSLEKQKIASVLDDLHDTFKQDVHVWIKEVESLGLNENYNPVYGRYKDQSIGVSDKVLTKYTIKARVHYFKKGEEDIADDTGLPTSENVVRLKVDADGSKKLKLCSFAEIDGVKHSVVSDPEGIGPFGPKYFKVYLKRDT